jgi:hypothetical protein
MVVVLEVRKGGLHLKWPPSKLVVPNALYFDMGFGEIAGAINPASTGEGIARLIEINASQTRCHTLHVLTSVGRSIAVQQAAVNPSARPRAKARHAAAACRRLLRLESKMTN